MELEVGPAHVSEHDGRLEDAGEGFDDKAVLNLLRGRDDEAVRHLAEIARVPVGGLGATHNNTLGVMELNSKAAAAARAPVRRLDQLRKIDRDIFQHPLRITALLHCN